MAISDKRQNSEAASTNNDLRAYSVPGSEEGCLAFGVNAAPQKYELSLKIGRFKPKFGAYRKTVAPLDAMVVTCTSIQNVFHFAQPEDELHSKMNAFRLDLLSSKEKARSFLQRAGILDRDGELAEPYRAA